MIKAYKKAKLFNEVLKNINKNKYNVVLLENFKLQVSQINLI